MFSTFVLLTFKRHTRISMINLNLLFFFFFGCATWLAGYQFPNQRLNLNHSSEGLTTRSPRNSFEIYLFIFGCTGSSLLHAGFP